jgi:tetratricopeptide (TPR) repeat protein
VRTAGVAVTSRRGNRTLLLTLGPVVGAGLATVINLLTSHWHWWLFGLLTALLAVTAAATVLLDDQSKSKGGDDALLLAGVSGLTHRRRGTKISTLPRELSAFTGRHEATAQLRTMIEAGARLSGKRIAVHSVQGIGGVGKTSLVVHIAHQVMRAYPDAVLFIELHAHAKGVKPMSTYEALGILLADLGVPGRLIPDDLAGRISLWRRELANVRALIILDDATGPDQVRDLLAGGDGCLFLITSRNRLIDLEGVSFFPLDTLPAGEAVELFRLHLGDERAAGQEDDILKAVQRLYYHPLAIKMAVSRLLGHPTRTVRDLLEEDLPAETKLLDVYDQLREMFELSYADLDEELQRFFRLLAVHPGAEITAETAAALAGVSLRDARRMLDELYNRFLVEEPLKYRFKLHDLTREFASREVSGMGSDPEPNDALQRLLKFYCFMASAASEKIGMHDLFAVATPGHGSGIAPPPDEPAALSWFDDELGNLLACASYANDQVILPFAWQIPALLMSYLRLRGFLGEAMSVLTRALQTLESEPDQVGEAIVRRRLGQAARLKDDRTLSREQLDRSYALTEELGDRQALAWCHHELGHLELGVGNFPSAREHFTAALAIHREFGYVGGEMAEKTNLGRVLCAQGEIGQARQYLQEALNTAAMRGDRRAEAFASYELGALERDHGAVDEGRELLTRALAIYQDTRNRYGQAECQRNLAIADRISGQTRAARKHLEEAMFTYIDLGYQGRIAQTHDEYAFTAEMDGDHAMASMHRQRAAAIRAEMEEGKT